MNIKHLAQTLDYKKVFNCIYKNYIKGNRQYDKDSIIKLDLYFRQLYSSLKKQKSSEEIKDKWSFLLPEEDKYKRKQFSFDYPICNIPRNNTTN